MVWGWGGDGLVREGRPAERAGGGLGSRDVWRRGERPGPKGGEAARASGCWHLLLQARRQPKVGRACGTLPSAHSLERDKPPQGGAELAFSNASAPSRVWPENMRMRGVCSVR